MRLLRAWLVRRQRQPMLSVQLELPDLSLQPFLLHELSRRTLPVCSELLLRDLRAEPHLADSCEHLRALRVELHHLRELDGQVLDLQVRHVFGCRPAVLHGSNERLLLEHAHEPLRKVRPEVLPLCVELDELPRVQLRWHVDPRWKLHSLPAWPILDLQLLLQLQFQL